MANVLSKLLLSMGLVGALNASPNTDVSSSLENLANSKSGYVNLSDDAKDRINYIFEIKDVLDNKIQEKYGNSFHAKMLRNNLYHSVLGFASYTVGEEFYKGKIGSERKLNELGYKIDFHSQKIERIAQKIDNE